MSRYLAYDTATGSIWQIMEGDDETLLRHSLPTGHDIIIALSGETDATHYIDTATGTAQAKATMAPGVTTATGEATLTDLPVPCEITTEGVTHTIDDGTAILSFDAQGTYTLKITAEPFYYPHTLEVEIP